MARLLFILLFLLPEAVSAAELKLLEDPEKKLSAIEAFEAFSRPGTRLLPAEKLNAGITSSVFWMLVPGEGRLQSELLLIDNPHINRIDFYGITNNKSSHIFTTGDHYPFKQRMIVSPDYRFPLGTAKYQQFLLRIDKHDESLSFSARVITQDKLYQLTSVKNLINGVLGGILAIIILFGLFLYISVKDYLYLYYVLYILMAFFWVFTNDGYSFQYFWPESPYLASRARLISNFLLLIAMIRFMQAFLGQTSRSKLFRPLRIIMVVNVVFFFLALLVPYKLAQNNSVIYTFLILNLTMVSGTIFLMIFSIAEEIRKKNQMAWFYFASVAALLLFIFTEIFVQAGVANSAVAFFQDYGIQTGIVAEAIILNFGLAHRFNQYKNEKETLLIEKNRKQQELSDRIIAVQEDERRRIAGQLHDEVGSMLSLANLQISSILEDKMSPYDDRKLAKAGEVLQSVSSTIRNMSHTLTPIAIEKYGLKNAVKDLTNTINLSGKLIAECVVVGFEQPRPDTQTLHKDLYHIIQELLNNILKHAHAGHCLIQLIEHPEAISILVEDDGIGIPDKVAESGIGLRNIRSKVDYLGGNLELTSKAEGGTLVVIEIPRPD